MKTGPLNKKKKSCLWKVNKVCVLAVIAVTVKYVSNPLSGISYSSVQCSVLWSMSVCECVCASPGGWHPPTTRGSIHVEDLSYQLNQLLSSPSSWMDLKKKLWLRPWDRTCLVSETGIQRFFKSTCCTTITLKHNNNTEHNIQYNIQSLRFKAFHYTSVQ